MRRALIVLLLFGACSSPSSCRTLSFAPNYLPAAFHPVARPKLVASERGAAWSDGVRTVYVLEGPNANLGDGTRPAKVRGHNANVGATGIEQAPLAVEWTDGCGATYAVLSKGLSESELLKIANAMR